VPPANVRLLRPVRWWPALLVLALAAGTLLWIWLGYGRQRQDRNIATALVVIATSFLLLLWCLFLSRLRWKIRLTTLGGVLGLALLSVALFRFHGVTGDLVPILQWRWEKSSPASLEERASALPRNAEPAVKSFTNDWPQFLGPHRDCTIVQPALGRDWDAQPPQRLWLRSVGPAWSGFAVAGNRAITQEQRGEDEAVVCYELLSGTPLWSHTYPSHFQSPLAGEGPRATPTVAGRRVYALGATGILNCLDLATGKLVWSKDTLKDSQAKLNEWGMSCSPLVVGDLVVVSAGGKNNRSLVAYRADTGDFAWGAGNDGAGYSSPCRVTLAGVDQILIFNSGGVSAHDPATGTNLWKYHWPGGHPHVALPVHVPGDRLLVSSGYGTGSELLQVQRDTNGALSATRIWKSNRLKAKFTNLVHRDGFIYGLDDGIMACLDVSNGQQRWKEGRYGHGQEILVGNALLIAAESGDVLLLEPDPKESRELTRFSALKGKMWNPPALAGEYLLLRTEREAACYRLPLAKP
jgi:outer membrane protein assembly factor BamB